MLFKPQSNCASRLSEHTRSVFTGRTIGGYCPSAYEIQSREKVFFSMFIRSRSFTIFHFTCLPSEDVNSATLLRSHRNNCGLNHMPLDHCFFIARSLLQPILNTKVAGQTAGVAAISTSTDEGACIIFFLQILFLYRFAFCKSEDEADFPSAGRRRDGDTCVRAIGDDVGERRRLPFGLHTADKQAMRCSKKRAMDAFQGKRERWKPHRKNNNL